VARWEYLYVTRVGSDHNDWWGWLDSQGRTGSIPHRDEKFTFRQDQKGREVTVNVEVADFTAMLTPLGEEGWELAGTITEGVYIRGFIFKRPRD
jgi:hypothetical protein